MKTTQHYVTTVSAADGTEQTIAYASTRSSDEGHVCRRGAGALGFFLWMMVIVTIIILAFVVSSMVVGFDTIVGAFSFLFK
jgi:hypothetical protein